MANTKDKHLKIHICKALAISSSAFLRFKERKLKEDYSPAVAPKNPKIHKNNPYPYLYVRGGGGIWAFFDATNMEPLCWIPDHYTAWASIYYVSFTVHRLTAEGGLTKDVRAETERLARELRIAHLREKAQVKTITGQLPQAMTRERSGENWWATDFKVLEQDGRSIMVRFLPDPGRAR